MHIVKMDALIADILSRYYAAIKSKKNSKFEFKKFIPYVRNELFLTNPKYL